MRIRLKQTLLVEASHECTAGSIWEVQAVITGTKPKSRCPRYLFMSAAGQMMTALADEAWVIDSARNYKTYTYEQYYGQSEQSSPPTGEENDRKSSPTVQRSDGKTIRSRV